MDEDNENEKVMLQTKELAIEENISNNNLKYNGGESTTSISVRLGEITCVGTTVIVLVLLLCIWIFYEFKDERLGI